MWEKSTNFIGYQSLMKIEEKILSFDSYSPFSTFQ